MLRTLAIAVAVFGAIGCASLSKSGRCVPIDPELYVEYGGLYDECTAEQRARIVFTPRIDYPYTAPRNVTCLVGILRFVVDTLGKPIPQTIEVAAANDERYVELMVAHLPQVRFAPGRVKGRPVHQIARWESRTAVASSVSTSRIAPSRSTSC